MVAVPIDTQNTNVFIQGFLSVSLGESTRIIYPILPHKWYRVPLLPFGTLICEIARQATDSCAVWFSSDDKCSSGKSQHCVQWRGRCQRMSKSQQADGFLLQILATPHGGLRGRKEKKGSGSTCGVTTAARLELPGREKDDDVPFFAGCDAMVGILPVRTSRAWCNRYKKHQMQVKTHANCAWNTHRPGLWWSRPWKVF